MTTWNPLLRDQFEWHWEHQLRPRLAGLSDEEYLWEPVAGSWSVRPRDVATAPMAAGAGAFTIDWAFPEPTPAPFTTIAWRLGHVIVGVLGMRNAAHFDRAPVDYSTFSYSGTAAGALTHLEHELGFGSTASARSAKPGLAGPAVPPRDRSPTRRWLSWCCTSTMS